MTLERPNELHQRQATESRLLKLFLQLILDVRAVRAQSVTMEESKGQLQLSLITADSAGQKQVVKTLAAPSTITSSWLSFLLDRVYFWPDVSDELFATNQSRFKRLLLAPSSSARLLADFTVTPKGGSAGNQMILGNIQLDNIKYLPETLALTPEHTKQLDAMLKQKTGLVLAAMSQKPHVIDSVAALLAVRPEACVVKHCNSEKAAGEAIVLAESHFVIVGMPGEDPVEMTLNFSGFVTGRKEIYDQFAQRFVGSFIHYRAKRVCAGCARSTPIDPRTLDRVPRQLRTRVKNTYMFGRGCDACGHNAYRGTVGLSSGMEIDGPFRELIVKAANAGDLTRYAYGRGTRSIFEDGLTKITAGLTSFEELFLATSKISSGFAGAIAAAEGEGAAADKGQIEAIDGEAFIAKDEAPLFKSKATPAAATKSKPRLMIVEDDADQRNVLEGVFRAEGYDVVGAENGQIALRSLKEKPVDLIICDIMMPVMNGAQFVKELRANLDFKNVPVLMLTAVSNPDAECALLSHGADDYCEKNVKRKVLLKRVEKLLQRKPKNPLEHMLRD